MNQLVIKNLTKTYGTKRGVTNVSLEIKEKEIFGFIGPNGAGKSTTIKCILNFLNKDKGTITFNGQPITKETKSNIGYLPSEINLYKELKVSEIIKYNSSFYKTKTLSKANELVKRLKLDTTKKIEELSLGNLKKIGIVLALMHSPKLIILDEATSGLDPLIQEEFFKILKEEKDNGATILFSSHNLSEVERLCDRVGIIKEGKLIKVENVKDIKKNKVLKVYIKSPDIKKKTLPVKNMRITNSTADDISFSYNGTVNELLQSISKLNVLELLITEPSLEEIFMHYYKED